MEFRALAADWVGGTFGLAADLQGRVLTPGHLARAKLHGCIKLGLEQLELLHCPQHLWGDLSCTLQKVVVLTRVLRQVIEQWGLVSSQRAGGMAGRVRCGVTMGRTWGSGKLCA